MQIREMTEGECRRTVPHLALGRLACAQGGQPYVVPVYLSLHDSYLYGFSAPGRKIESMRANPLVCVEIEDLTKLTEWTTFVVFGTYEELPQTEEYESERILAHELLQARAMWWEPAFVEVANAEQSKTFIPIFYRIRIDQITGHRATPDPTSSLSAPGDRQGFWRQIWRRIRSSN